MSESPDPRFSPAARISSMAMAFTEGREAEVIAWLERMGCTVTTRDDEVGEYCLMGSSGIASGLCRGEDPVTATVMINFLILGELWARPELCGGEALALTNKAWAARSKAAKQKAACSP
jgi:hypothetical protein